MRLNEPKQGCKYPVLTKIKSIMKTLIKQITKQINELSQSDLIRLHNTYCQSIGYDDEIYSNDDEFFEIFFSGKVIEAVRAISYGEYNYSDAYVKFNGYGNLESFSHFGVNDLGDSPQVIAEYAIENQSDFDMLDFSY